MVITERIEQHLSQHNLDIRRTHNARFMDQKVTPDVLCFIADCIINYVANDTTKEFTTKDIWDSQYFEKNVRAIFGKPSPIKKTASSEYDKFIAQPMKTLDYAEIFDSEKRGNKIYYTIANYDILEYISIKERNAYVFLYIYLQKVLSDCGFSQHIDRFKDACLRNKNTRYHFGLLKSRFQRFIIGNTPINGETEVNRIFPKVINIIASQEHFNGTVSGRISCDIFHYNDLMYNRVNWRDFNKIKGQTRKEAELVALKRTVRNQKKIFNNYRVERAINFIKNKYSQSEITDKHATGPATHVHHIFPKSKFPSIKAYIENLIKRNRSQKFFIKSSKC